MRADSASIVYVDYDGTITDQDTFDVLAREHISPELWHQIEQRLHGGTMALREVLSLQVGFLKLSLDDADALLAAQVRFDPTFAVFVKECAARGVALAILSSGAGSLIARALGRHGLSAVPLFASDVAIETTGWVMRHRDASANGHDKEAAVRAAKASGARVVYVGDGVTDYDAALAADVRFAKRGRMLERFLSERQVSFTAFDTFAQIQAALFPV